MSLKDNTVGPRYNVIGYNRRSLWFLGPNETFPMVFYLVITVIQYNSQNADAPMEPFEATGSHCKCTKQTFRLWRANA